MSETDNNKNLIEKIKKAKLRIAENQLIIIKARIELLAQSDERGFVETQTELWDTGCGVRNTYCNLVAHCGRG